VHRQELFKKHKYNCVLQGCW